MNPNPKESGKLKLLVFALLPYAYVFTVLTIVFGIFGLFAWTIITANSLEGAVVRIEIALVVLAALFLRAIWVGIPIHNGLTLREEDAPALFAMVREIEQKLKGPKIHGILLIDEFRVAASPFPVLSLFGWPVRYYLKIGLPLMHALPPEQFKAVVAGEMSQFASSCDWYGSWINARRITWSELLSALVTRRRWGSWLLSRFFNSYLPRFHIYSMPRLRQHQLEVDLCAGAVAGSETAADALVRLEYATYLETEYWEDQSETFVRRWPIDEPNIARLLDYAIAANEAKAWLDSALEAPTSFHTTRPSLRERLANLGQEPRLPSSIAETAADVFLADRLDDLTQRLKIAEEERIGPRAERDNVPVVSQDLNELIRRSQEPDFTGDEALALGARMLADDREEGVAFVQRAIEMNDELNSIGYIHLSSYYMRKGDIVTANRYSQTSADRWQVLAKAQAERTQVSFVDQFLPQNLSKQELEELRRELAKHKQVKAAYLVRKDVRYLPDIPLHALGLVLDRPWFSKANNDTLFAKRLPHVVKKPPELYSFVLDYRNRRLANVIRSVPGSLIFQRN